MSEVEQKNCCPVVISKDQIIPGTEFYDMQRGAISQEDARKAKDYVRDLLYDALRDANISVEAFEQSISSERVYQRCGITRTANPRGRPPKEKAGEQV